MPRAYTLQLENTKWEIEDYWNIERIYPLDGQTEMLRGFSYCTKNARISDYVLNLTPETSRPLNGLVPQGGDAKPALVLLSFSTTNDFLDWNLSLSS
jgi:hypothetical protein